MSILGGQPLRWVEYFAGVPVPIESWEPDATTYHENYYYNARENVLFQRVIAPAGACAERTEYVWKRLSERR
jgi:hypothetical protein